ncbi:hypothetical protein HYT57_00340 [Candidatus Woesearchaeota archaeon]|nr:hypothetical protein [Candidatus Woesearchaeota archaeon]
MLNKKSQAAMEFLMTYGWAIMIVLIGIGALFFLGVFNPSTPSTCNIASPFICQDIKVAYVVPQPPAPPYTELTLRIAATGIDSASLTAATGVTINGNACPITTPAPIGGTSTITSAKDTPLNVICRPVAVIAAGSKASGTFEIAYTKQFGVSHKVAGSFAGTVEEG